MRRSLSVMLLGAGILAASPASAQSWGIYVGNGDYPLQHRVYDEDDDGLERVICSGERAHGLEGRLRHEIDEEEIDYRDADRIHGAIDRLEDRQRHECAEGDRRAIYDIASRYDRIAEWIDSEAHGPRRWNW